MFVSELLFCRDAECYIKGWAEAFKNEEINLDNVTQNNYKKSFWT